MRFLPSLELRSFPFAFPIAVPSRAPWPLNELKNRPSLEENVFRRKFKSEVLQIKGFRRRLNGMAGIMPNTAGCIVANGSSKTRTMYSCNSRFPLTWPSLSKGQLLWELYVAVEILAGQLTFSKIASTFSTTNSSGIFASRIVEFLNVFRDKIIQKGKEAWRPKIALRTRSPIIDWKFKGYCVKCKSMFLWMMFNSYFLKF